jgi:glycine betaine/proline transport system permease protein
MIETKWNIGLFCESLIQTFIDRYAQSLGSFADDLTQLLDSAQNKLNYIPPLGIIVFMTLLVLILHRKIFPALLSFVCLTFIYKLQLWTEMLETALLITLSTSMACFIGIPIGIFCSKKPKCFSTLRPILDLMQTLPTFVYLIPTLMLFGLGLVPGFISTIIFVLPVPIRMTYLGFQGVPPQLKEVGEAFGLTPWQQMRKIDFPHAMPLILSGVSQCMMLSLSMVVVAALVGASGLGKSVVVALNTVNMALGIEAGLSIVLLAVMLDRILKIPHNKEHSL